MARRSSGGERRERCPAGAPARTVARTSAREAPRAPARSPRRPRSTGQRGTIPERRSRFSYYARAAMFGLHFGEIFVLVFIVVAVVSAPFWPRAGAAIAVAILGKSGKNSKSTETPSKPPPG